MSLPEKIIPLCCLMPSFILYKGIICPQIHRKRLATMRAMRNQFRWNRPFRSNPLCYRQFTSGIYLIALRIEYSLFIKACLLETVIHIRSQAEIILVFYKFQQSIIGWCRWIAIPIDPDISAPIRPVLLQRIIRDAFLYVTLYLILTSYWKL